MTLTEPAAAAFEPFPNVTLAGRHLPLSRICPALHLDTRAANTPNLPFANVASQRKIPELATVRLSVIVPVFASKLACATKPLSSGGLGLDGDPLRTAAGAEVGPPPTDTRSETELWPPALSVTVRVTV